MLIWLAACVSTTGGERVSFTGEVRADVQQVGPLTWTDDAGWQVRLFEGVIYAGPVYLWSDPPLIDVGWSLRDLLVGRAHAQADQFEAGFVTGEFTRQVRVDLLDPTPVSLGDGVGFAGPSQSAEIWLEPGPAGAPTLSLRGEARRDGVVVPFVGELLLDERWFDVAGGENPLVQRRVRGIPWDAELAEGGRVEVTVDPRRLVAGIDWEALSQSAPVDGQHRIAPGTQAGNVLRDRVRQTGPARAWTFSWSEP